MGLPVKGYGTGGRGHLDSYDLLQGSDEGNTTLWVGDVGDVPIHEE